MSTTEAELWRTWRERRDGRAFEALVRPHLGFAAGLARRLGCAAADADDVVQRSLVSLATETRDKPARVGMRAWLGRSVLSEARMLFRARGRREAHEGRAVREPAPAGNPLDARDEVEALLATLGDDARRAVELRFLYDLDYREIAHVLQKSPLACRLQVHRAVSTLRRRLGSHAAMLVAALPHRVGETASVSVSAAAASAPAATASLIAGGVAMAIVWKVAGVAAGVALAGWLGWTALRPAGDASDEVARTGDAPAPAMGLAVAPPRPAARVGEDPGLAGRSPPAAPAAGEVPLVPVPLDAPIPPGTGSVAGVIRFADGAPATGLRVALSGWTKIESVTDAEGRFHLHGEWMSDRRLVIVGPHEYALYLDPVTMKVDERVHIDVVIERGVTLSGEVTDSRTRAPVAAAFLVMRRPGAGMFAQAGAAWVRTDEAGRFRFDHVPPDTYSLTCEATGHEFQSLSLEVAGRPVTQDFALRDARSLVVRIGNLPEEAIGRVMTVMFTAKPPDGPPTGLRSYDSKAPIGADGTVRLEAPPVGEWRMILFGDEVVPRFEQDVSVTAENVPSLAFTLPATVRVTGTLYGPDGPLANASVGLGAPGRVTTDAQGRFAFPRVVAGPRTPYLHYDNSYVRLARVDIPAAGPASVDLHVEGSAQVTATLLGADVAGLWEEAGSDTVAIARPDARGRIRIPYLAAGSYRLSSGQSDGEFVERRFQLLPGQSLDLGEIRRPKFPVLPVVVSVPAGTAVPLGLSVTVLRDIGGTRTGKVIGQGRIEVDTRGRGTLKGLPEGEFLVSIYAPGFRPVETTLVVRDGITTPVPIELRKP